VTLKECNFILSKVVDIGKRLSVIFQVYGGRDVFLNRSRYMIICVNSAFSLKTGT